MPLFMYNGSTGDYEYQARNGSALSFGNSTVSHPLLYTQKAIKSYTTCASTNASTSFEPLLFYTTLTGAGQVGGRARFFMTANVALGGWSNALKGEVTYGAAGRTTGLGSSVAAEMTLSAGTSQGNYAPLEIELNVPSGASTGTKTAFGYWSANGADVATFQHAGNLLTLVGLGSASASHYLFHTTGTVSATHGLRISIDGVDYDLLMKVSTYA